MAAGNYRELLKRPGFPSYLWTQFLGAFNDNTFKIVVSLVAVDAAVQGEGSLSLVGVVFMAPFFFCSGYAGQLADLFSKRTVQVVTKFLEIVAMGLGCAALASGRLEAMLAVLLLMALHSTFFSPAKYGILPEMLPERDLSRANGLLEMTTFMAIVLGTAIGSVMYAAWKGHPAWIGLILTLIAIMGTAASFGIPRVPPAGVRAPFRLNPWGEIVLGVRRLYGQKPLWLTVLGISYFWFLGALLQMVVLVFGKELLRVDDLHVGILVTFLAVGIGIGSLTAGRLSGDKVELGLVPLGSIGMGVFSLLLAGSSRSYLQSAAMMALLGFTSGFFIVPLNSLLQQKSGREETGRILATNNFLNTAGVLAASGAFWLCHDRFRIPPDRILAIFGVASFLVTVYILTVLPDFLIRFSLWLLTHTIYRIRIAGVENVPFRGPALLVSNHMSFVDGLLVGACVQRFVRFLVYKPYYEMKAVHWLLRLMKAIPVAGGNRHEMLASLERARAELEAGHVVCIFAEGSISRTGNLLPFKRGFERIVDGLKAPVIPVHLDGLWGSVFSFQKGRFFWKWPQRIPYPVTASFGDPLPSSATAREVRQAVAELGCAALEHRHGPGDVLPLRFIRTARRNWWRFAMADSSGRELTFARVLAGALLLRRALRLGNHGEGTVGLLLPPSIGGALANLAVSLAGKTPVNLNFTTGREAMASGIAQCCIRTIVTSRVFLAKAKIEPAEGMVYLEDALPCASTLDKALAFAEALLVPARWLVCGRPGPQDMATVIFSSGSTGTPKGIMLSHHNVLSNIEAIATVFWLQRSDRILGVLPLFHSFGFTAGLWLPLVVGFGAVYHPSPVDAQKIGELVQKYHATLLISTPTFYSTYARKCAPEQFASLRWCLVGAEKLRESVAHSFREKFGLDLLEGYGCTEMSPVVAVNIPDVDHAREHQTGTKPGTVGHPLPGVVAKVVDPDTGGPLPGGKEGLLLVKGPNRMIGYLGQPEKTAAVFRDGWYVTGDIAAIDDEGFLRITDRLSRFSKIGGEMVPHLKVEEAIAKLIGGLECVVTAVPDEQKGERLVVFHTNPEITAATLWERLNQTDMPKIWIPKRENLCYVEAIPKLGTGKVDLRQVKAMAVISSG